MEPIVHSTMDNYVMEDFKTLSIVLCGIGDPHNLGSILRSAYFCGVDKVYTVNCTFEGMKNEPFLKSTAPLSPVVSKSSSGVLELFQPVHINDSIEFIRTMQSKGCTIVGSGIKSESIQDVQSYDSKSKENENETKKRHLLIIGNEGFGIPNYLSKMCDKWIYLQPGRDLDSDVDSLNVSVATALLINSMKNLKINSNLQ